jgi:hypothetical protein
MFLALPSVQSGLQFLQGAIVSLLQSADHLSKQNLAACSFFQKLLNGNGFDLRR